MKRAVSIVLYLLGCCLSLYAEPDTPEIKLRDLDLDGLLINKGGLTLTVTFDAKRERVFDEVIFDFYLLLEPQKDDLGLQFLHCRTVHRYLDEKTGLKSAVLLQQNVLDGINPRTKCKYAVVATYRGKEVGVENSEQDRWWEDPALGAPVEDLFVRMADIPIVREWESVGKN